MYMPLVIYYKDKTPIYKTHINVGASWSCKLHSTVPVEDSRLPSEIADADQIRYSILTPLIAKKQNAMSTEMEETKSIQ